jgi:hypothetical protein
MPFLIPYLFQIIKKGTTGLLWSSYHGEIDIVRLFIDAKVNINHQNQHGLSALMMAASCKHHEVGVLLIRNGADLTLKDIVSSTLFHSTVCCFCCSSHVDDIHMWTNTSDFLERMLPSFDSMDRV